MREMFTKKLVINSDLCALRASFENTGRRVSQSAQAESLDSVIPAWSAGIQVYMDVPEASLRIRMPAIHAGMTNLAIFMLCGRE
jgi:hypothetical protein